MDWSAAHSGFVLASYALSFVVLAILVAFIYLRGRKLTREIDAFERRDARER